MAAPLNSEENRVPVLPNHGKGLPAIAHANPNDLKKYKPEEAGSSYWLSDEDIMAAVKPLSSHPNVYKPELVIPVISQFQFGETEEKRLLENFEGSDKKLFFVFEQVKITSGDHWQLHCWQKDENGTISKNSYDPKGDGRCGDRAIAKAYQLAESITGEDIAATKLDLFEDGPNCLDEQSLKNKRDVREQTITLIRKPVTSQNNPVKHSETVNNHAEQAAEISSDSSPELPDLSLTETHPQDESPVHNAEDLESLSHYSAYIRQHSLFAVKRENEQGIDDSNEVKNLSEISPELIEILPELIKEDNYNNDGDAWFQDQISRFEFFSKNPQRETRSDSKDADESNNEQSIVLK